MFPFQQGSELSFQVNDGVRGQEEDINIQDLILYPNNNTIYNNALASTSTPQNISFVAQDNIINRNNRGRGARGRGRTILSSNPNDYIDKDYERKIFNREVERVRRLEMSNLYVSLRNLLPSEYVKGKRSISEHVGQAEIYIKDLEKNVKELGEKRDELRQLPEAGSSSGCNLAERAVNIRQIEGGLEIEVNVGCEDERFSLSKALKIADEEGLIVESYSSTKVDNKFIHHLVCQVSRERTCIDLNQLQQRLLQLVSLSSIIM